MSDDLQGHSRCKDAIDLALNERDAALLQVEKLKKDMGFIDRARQDANLQVRDYEYGVRKALTVMELCRPEYSLKRHQESVASAIRLLNEARPVEKPKCDEKWCELDHDDDGRHVEKPIGDQLRELAATVPVEEWKKLSQKRHPFTCGECRAEIRTDVCPKCAEKRKDEDPHPAATAAFNDLQATLDQQRKNGACMYRHIEGDWIETDQGTVCKRCGVSYFVPGV